MSLLIEIADDYPLVAYYPPQFRNYAIHLTSLSVDEFIQASARNIYCQKCGMQMVTVLCRTDIHMVLLYNVCLKCQIMYRPTEPFSLAGEDNGNILMLLAITDPIEREI